MIDYLFGDVFRNPGGLFEAFGRYNESIWPVPLFAYILGIIIIFLGIKRIKPADNIILFLLALVWLWAGIICLLVHLAADYPVFYVLGALITIQGILLLVYALKPAGQLFHFEFKADFHGFLGGLYFFFALILYPLIGNWAGNPYPNHPVFGTAPCPTCIFTFGVFLWARKKVPAWLLIIPLIEAALGVLPVYLGLYADIALVIGGIYAFYLILRRNKQFENLNF